MTFAGVMAVAALISTACSSLPDQSGGSESLTAEPGQRLWQSDGYGRVYALRGDRLRSFETTGISCMPSESLTRTGAVDEGGGQGFGSEGSVEATFRVGADGRAVFHEVGTVSEIDLVPISAPPAACGQEPGRDPLATFDVFWATFNENYNSLSRKNVDWVALRDRYRPTINGNTSDQQLFGIMRAMIEPFGDMHTGLSDGDDREFEGKRPGTVEIDAEKTDRAIDTFLLGQGATNYSTFGKGMLVYADLPNGRGYLRINAFEGLSEDDEFAANSAEVNRMLNAVFTAQRVAALRMLVIDVRNNAGGEDALGTLIAGRLTDRPYTAYTKAARNNLNNPDQRARPQPVQVTPAAGPRYTGPVRLLTSPLTISAGETFTLATMGRTPAPERFGETTQGVFSDTLSRQLPNGWEVTLGNEDFTGPNGRIYEGPGIPPTRPMPVFQPAELVANHDSTLAAALR